MGCQLKGHIILPGFDKFSDPISLHVVSENHHDATQSAFLNLNIHVHEPCISDFGYLDRVVVVFDSGG